MLREEDIEKPFCRKAKALGLYPIKFTDPARRGAPDRMILGPMGLVFFVEFKRPGVEEPSPLQKRYHAFLRDIGFNVHMCNSIEDIHNILDSYAF